MLGSRALLFASFNIYRLPSATAILCEDGFCLHVPRQLQLDSANRGGEKPLYIFVHIPTTGGRSFTSALTNAGWNLQSPATFNVHNWTDQDAEDLKWACRDDSIDMINGHISYKEIEPILRPGVCRRPTRVVVILRSPTERAKSWLLHQAPATDYDTFVMREENTAVLQNIQNRMTYQVGDFALFDARSTNESYVLQQAKRVLSNAFYVLFTETLSDDFAGFEEQVGLSNVDLPHSATPSQAGRSFTAADEETVENLNAMDMELYQWAKQRHH